MLDDDIVQQLTTAALRALQAVRAPALRRAPLAQRGRRRAPRVIDPSREVAEPVQKCSVAVGKASHPNRGLGHCIFREFDVAL